MTIFKLNKNYSVICESQSTRNGFRHVAVIMKNGYEIGRTKVCYLNCTWEAYTFQSVLNNALGTLYKEDLSKNLRSRFYQRIATGNFAKS